MATKNMFKAGNIKNRPEQLLIAEVLKFHLPSWAYIKTEKKITYVTEFKDKRDAIIDIFVVYDEAQTQRGFQYLIRVMGPRHDNGIVIKKDSLQKGYLLALAQIWPIKAVIDLHYFDMPITFKRNERLLIKDEAIEAYCEIRDSLDKYFGLPKRPYENWFEKSVHIK